MKHVLRRVSTSKALWMATALLLVYALIGHFVVPYLIERSVLRYAEENLGVHAQIGKVRFNPLLLKLEASDSRLDAAARATS
jgi:hypothetical protein